MRHLKLFCMILMLISLITITGCTFNRADTANRAKSSLIGLSQENILQCMGAANAVQKAGKTEVWQYNSGGRYVGSTTLNTYGNFTYGTTQLRRRSCSVNIFFNNGKVSKVLYSGRTGGIFTQGEQCAYAVKNCMR